MKYIIKQKWVAVKPTYEIMNGSGSSLYKVKGSFVGRENFKITDMNNQTLAECGTKVNALSILGSFLRYNFKKYHITAGDKTILSLSRSLNIFTYKFNVESPLGNIEFGYGMNGSHQFKLNGTIICDIDKRNLTMGSDECHIEIDDAYDQNGFLLSAIALDRIIFTKR